MYEESIDIKQHKLFPTLAYLNQHTITKEHSTNENIGGLRWYSASCYQKTTL